MEVEVLVVRREGKIVPKWQHAFGKRPRGHLIIEDHQDKELNRTIRIARLLRTDREGDAPLLPPLYDVQIVHAAPSMMVLTGFERRDELPGVSTPTCYLQSWCCRDPNVG